MVEIICMVIRVFFDILYFVYYVINVLVVFFNSCICFLIMMVVDIIINRNIGVYRCNVYLRLYFVSKIY